MAKVTKREVATCLRRAAKLIEAGWTKGVMYRKEGGIDKFCAIGSIRQASGSYNYLSRCYGDGGGFTIEDAARKKVKDTLRIKLGYRLCFPMGWNSIMGWNDTMAKEAKEVAKLFREAAADLDHGGSL